MDYSSPEHKDIYEIDIKDGNRIGRRLGGNIGSAASELARGAKETLITEPFDPNAYDGDGDGIIQDGTVWKRPVVLRAQSVPGLIPNAINKPDREALRGADTTDIPSPSTGTTRPRKGTRVGLRSGTTPETTSREWRDTATPQELAEAFVPESKEASDALAEHTNVRRSDYKTEADYQTALSLHREFVSETERISNHTIASLQSVYDSKYGEGAFDSDSMPTVHANIQALFGSDKEFAEQFSVTADIDELNTQYRFIKTLMQNATIPSRLKGIFDELETIVNAHAPITHSMFWHANQQTRTIDSLPVSPMEYVMARLVGEMRDGNDRLIPGSFMGQDVEKDVTPMRVSRISGGWETAELLMQLYFDARETVEGDRALSDEQISARFKLAKLNGSRRALFGTVFPTNSIERNSAVSGNMLNTTLARSNNPRDYKMVRALVQRTLEQNPEYLSAVRQYGMPVIFIPHRSYSILTQPDELTERLLVTPIAELSTAELRARRLIGKAMKEEREKILELRRDGQMPEYGATNVLGSAHLSLGGYYQPGSNTMVVMSDWLLTSIFNPPTAEEGIIPLSKIRSLDDFIGEAGVLLHEYGHYMDLTIQSTLAEAMWERARRKLDIIDDMQRQPGAPPHATIKRMTDQVMEDFRQGLIALPPHDGYGDVTNRQRTFLNKLRNERGDAPIDRVSPNARTIGPILFSPSSLSESELDAQIQELTGQVMEIHGDQLLLRRRQMLIDSDRTGASSLDKTEEIAADSMSSPEPYVITPYGNKNTRERFAELTAATLSRIGQKYPVLVNNAAVKLMERLTGMSTEQQDVTTLTRRIKGRGGRYSDDTEDITKRIISTIKLVAPDSERSSDGHRPGLGSSTISESLRFNPDERSMAKSVSNIGIDTDERLYAFSEPLYVRDFPSKPRTFTIGDYHFYDDDIPFGSRPSSGQRTTLGVIAAQAFTNRNRPHHGDMMRAISATQFGMFVDDMPTYRTTTAGQTRVLRGLVTGKISKLHPDEREQIERAFKDANNLHQLIQMARPTKRDIYRAVNIDSETFMESVTVGDIIPMPLTTFSADSPGGERGVMLRLIKGAKAVDDNGRFVTQGNFEVTDISRSDTGVLMATIRHTEVFDPRHNAMRAVDKDADTPRSMRAMGGSKPRYNESQVLRMETDLSQRRDRAASFGLRSTTTNDSAEIDKIVDDYVEAVKNGEESDGSDVISAIGPSIKEFIGDSVAQRLGKTLLGVMRKRNDKSPWIDDSESIQGWREIPHSTVRTVGRLVRNTIKDRIDSGDVFNSDGTPLVYQDRAIRNLLSRWSSADTGLTATQIRHFLRTGELTYQQSGESKPEPYFIKIPEIMPRERRLLADAKTNRHLDDFEEMQRVLELTADALEAVQRAYILDGSEREGDTMGDVWTEPNLNGVVPLGDTNMSVHPQGAGVYVSFNDRNSRGLTISVAGTFGKQGTTHSISNGFERSVYTTRTGKIVVEHERMWMGDKTLKSSGLGTLLNQYAALWWRRIPDGEFSVSSPVADGVIVWPRLGYTIDIDRGSIPEFMRRRNNLVDAVKNAIIKNEAGVNTDPLFRQRLIGWLALARKHEQSGTPDPELVTLLANIIDTKKLSKDHLKKWNKIFDDSSITDLGLVMGFDKGEDGTSVDNDWLPDFLIPDPSDSPLDYVEERKNSRTRAQILQTAFSSDEDIDRDLFIGSKINTASIVGGQYQPMTSEQAGRLYGTLVGRREHLAHLREKYGFNTTPTLFTRADVDARGRALGSPLYGIGDINPSGDSPSLTRFISGTGDSSDVVTFTSEPWRHLPEMYVDGLPNSDPATTRNGIIGYLAPWAQVAEVDDIRKALDNIVPQSDAQEYLLDENFDGLVKLIADKHFRKYEWKPATTRTPSLSVYDESFAFNISRSADTPIRNRILKAVMDLENAQLVQNHSGSQSTASKMLQTRNALLAALFSDKPDRHEVVATLLGYDAIKKGNDTTVLNNGAMSVMDEVVSFAEAAKLLNDPTYSVIPENMPFNVTGDAEWFTGTDTRLLTRDDAIVLPANGVIPSSYIRSVRQDFNVDLSERRGRGISSKTTGRASKILSNEQAMRRIDRQPNSDGWDNPDDSEFKKKLADLKLRYKNTITEDEAWDAANMDLDNPDWDAHKEIQSRKNVIIDHITSLILTSNMAIEQAIEHEAAIQALAGFLKERDGDNALKDIPQEVLQTLDGMLNTLMDETNNRPSVLSIDKARKRHAMLKKVLNDFDLGYDVRHSAAEFGDDDIELADLDPDVDVMDKSEAYLEHLFRGLFDENYDKWSERQSRFDRFISQENRSADDVMEKRFRELFKGITKEQRREWHSASGQLLDDEYNWEYEEDIIDATPVGGSTRPSEVPAPTWRKIRSAMSRARATTYDGERQAAEDAALRLIGKHRPDLATREYVRGIRSSTSGSLPASRVNFATKPMRGSAPDAPSTPVAMQSLSVTAEKLRTLGHDVTEEDLLPNGKVGAVMRNLTFLGGWPITLGTGKNDTVNTAKHNTGDLELFLMSVEKGLISKDTLGSNSPELIRDLVSTTTEQARKQGLSIIKIEGHSSKKVLGPIDDEVVDILGDEVDIALLRAHGSPTYEQLMDIAAHYYAEKKRLNKMFGEKDNETPSQHVALGAYGKTMNASPVVDVNTLRYLDDRGNEVASFDLSDKASVKEIMDAIQSPFVSTQPRSLYSVLKIDEYADDRGLNNVLFGAMAEVVGYESEKIIPRGIADLRKELENLKSLIALYSFSPSPAGQHLRSMFEDKIASRQMQLDLMERMGQRYVHLLKERGLSDGDIRTTLKTLMSQSRASMNEGKFTNGSPVQQSKGTILQQALTGFLRKNLASPSIPMFSDLDVSSSGLHEIGHFALGQGFTRHGEFVANAWPMFVHGKSFWPLFATIQRNQTGQFDQWTIKEHFNRILTPEQLSAITPVNSSFVQRIGREKTPHIGLSDEDRAIVRDDVIKSVRARNDISDVEKQQVIDDINYTYDNNDFFVTSVAKRREPMGDEMEMEKLTGIPANLWDEEAASTQTHTFFDPLIPIPSRIFGWQRTDNSGFGSKTIDENAKEVTQTVATLQQRREFASMLRAVNQMMGGRPVFVGNETPEEMRMVEKMMKEKKRLAQRKLSTIIDGLKRFYKRYPELRADFADEIKELGL